MKKAVLLAAVVVIFASLGGTARFLVSQWQAAPSAAPPTPAVGGTLPPPPVLSARPAVQPRPPPAEAVDNPLALVPTPDNTPLALFAPREAYPLADWHGEDSAGGAITQIQIAGTTTVAAASTSTGEHFEPLSSRPLTDQDELAVYGWAGDAVLGLRFPSVVFSLCEHVIGAATVQGPSPQIARSVHPNLTNALWSARLPLALLPRCAQPVLQAWAIGAGGYLYPLKGRYALALPTSDPRLLLPTSHLAFMPLIRPDTLPALARQVVRVSSTGANLRQCGQITCAVTGVLTRGDFPATILESRHGWTLVLTEDKGGWISDGTYTLLSPQQAREHPLTAGAAPPAGAEPKLRHPEGF